MNETNITDEQIEGNTIFAIFEGYNTYESNGFLNVEYSDDNVRTIVDTHYHSSLDWMLPSIEKIEKIVLSNDNSFNITIGPTKFCSIKDSNGNLIEINEEGTSKLEATYKAIIKFIKWYNTSEKYLNAAMLIKDFIKEEDFEDFTKWYFVNIVTLKGLKNET